MKQWIRASWVLALVSAAPLLAEPKTRTDLLLPREDARVAEELGPDALGEVVTWARTLVDAGMRGDAEAARNLLAAAPASIAPAEPEEPVVPGGKGDDITILLPPFSGGGKPTGTTAPEATDEPPAGVLVEVLNWCNEMVAAARAGDAAACEEVLSRVPLTLPVVTQESKSGGGLSAGAAAGVGIGCAVAGIIIGAIVMAVLRM